MEESGSADLKYPLDPAAWVLPGKINAMENCAHCNWGLTILPGEVNVRFIVLLHICPTSNADIKTQMPTLLTNKPYQYSFFCRKSVLASKTQKWHQKASSPLAKEQPRSALA